MNAPTILFRCDASPALGLGHLMRCIALAEALRARGARPVFVVRTSGVQTPSAASSFEYQGTRRKQSDRISEPHESAAFAPTSLSSRPRLRPLEGAYSPISQRQFEAVGLPLGAPRFDETLDEIDASALIRIIRDTRADAVIVDHYGADERYLAAIRSHVATLGVIDDLADRDLRDCDWALNPSPTATALFYRLCSDAMALLGPTFALLREEFSSRPKAIADGPVSDRHASARVLVTLGGGDQATRMDAIVEALSRSPRTLHIRCIGRATEPEAQAPGSVAKLETLSTEDDAVTSTQPQSLALGVRVEAIAHQPNIAPLLAWADVVVTAGGATCWELCALGVPQVAIALEANQEPNVAGIDAIGAGMSLGRWDAALTPAMSATAVELLLATPALRARMSQVGPARVDGGGADRAARILLDRIIGNRTPEHRPPTGPTPQAVQHPAPQMSGTTREVSHA